MGKFTRLTLEGAPALAKPNYNFEKRQRELAKKKKKEEKMLRKQAAKEAATESGEAGDATSSTVG